MASNLFIQDLIAQLQADGVKSAADDDKAKKGKDDKDKDDKKDDKDDKSERENAFRERMKHKKEEREEKEEKKASSFVGGDFDILAGLESLPEDLRKLASAEASAEFLADMARQNAFGFARSAPQQEQKQAAYDGDNLDATQLFNDVFEMHTAKLASLDPEYGAMLEAEQEKMAFNQGFEDTVKEAQQRLGVNPFAQFGGA